MKILLSLLTLSLALLASGQGLSGGFDRVIVTSHAGEQIELHDVEIQFLRKGLLAVPGPVSYTDGEEAVVAWRDVLALTAAPTDGVIGWYIVLTNGEVLPGWHGDLRIEGTRTGPIEPLDASSSFAATITSYDPGGLDHVSVVIPGNLSND